MSKFEINQRAAVIAKQAIGLLSCKFNDAMKECAKDVDYFIEERTRAAFAVNHIMDGLVKPLIEALGSTEPIDIYQLMSNLENKPDMEFVTRNCGEWAKLKEEFKPLH